MQPPFYLVSLLSVCISTVALSACQPTTDGHQSGSATEKSLPATTTVPPQADTGSSIAGDEDGVYQSPTLTQDLSEVQQDYRKAIANMREEMQLVFFINNVDVAFARGMLGHHRGAVDLTKFEQRYGSDSRVRLLADDILETEQVEIDALRKWLASHPDTHSVEPATGEARQAYQYAMDAMNHRMLTGIASQSPDVIFAKTILAHHRGAEAMAKIQLKYGENEEMRALAEQIINEQLGEIAALEAWLESQGVETNPRLVAPIASAAEEESQPSDSAELTPDHSELLEDLTDTPASLEAS